MNNSVKNMLINVVKDVTDTDIKINGEPKEDLVVYTDKKKESYAVKQIHIKDIRNDRSWKIRENLLEWKGTDFAMYFIQKFKSKIYQDWSVRRLGFSLQIGRIKNSISEAYGFCDNIVLKNYMDFFIDNWGYYYFRRCDDNFYIGCLKYKEPIADFIGKYDYRSNFEKEVYTEKETEVAQKVITDSEINKVFLIGPEAFILEYGVVLPLNWLIKSKKFTANKSIKYVSSAFKNIYNKGNWKSIIKITKELSPYPDWYVAKDYGIIFNGIEGFDADLDIVFSDSATWCNF